MAPMLARTPGSARIALATSRVSDRFGRRASLVLAGAMMAANLYLYPLATAREIPVAPYRHVLSMVDLTG